MIDKGYKLPTRSYLRPTVQYINALGGGVLLDVFDENEIKKITVDYITFSSSVTIDSLGFQMQPYHCIQRRQ